MSEFDKEAERQKLREKYERDEEKRRSTQRMSELLLKGATMTNKHCDRCGDPIFRYDGQEFCPTCQTQGQAATSADEDAENAAEAVADAEATQRTAEDATAGSQHAPDDAVGSSGTAASTQSPTTDHAQMPSTTDHTPTTDRTQTTERASSARGSREYTPRAVEGDVSGARESLVRTLTWATEQAESTDDPRRAKEFLAAAREAAEAIAALDR